MSIDTCEVCKGLVDTDEYPKAYRKKLDYKCVCDDCFDYYYTDKEEKHRGLVTPARESVGMEPVAWAHKNNITGEQSFMSSRYAKTYRVDTSKGSGQIPLYSAEQLAQVQRESEMHANNAAALHRALAIAQNSDEHNFNHWQSVKAERDELLETLKFAKETLERENEKLYGAISDTIWHTEYETLFDFMDRKIAKLEGKKP